MNVAQLWDFADPVGSEERFRAALATATGDDALILQTQIARTYGLRRDFATAQRILAELELLVQRAGAEAQARHALEYGRTLVSAMHPDDAMTEGARSAARMAYLRAHAIAADAQLDDLAIDALHMLAFVDTAPADQLHWAQQALAIAAASAQPAAQRWEAALRNNIGYALHQLGRYDEALVQFTHAVALRERAGDVGPLRIAYWMVAWTLRSLGRIDEALAIQLRLEREWAADGEPDPYVFEELALLYRARGENVLADAYMAKQG
jgi:tetratricopeptide (TPR) repeat protein